MPSQVIPVINERQEAVAVVELVIERDFDGYFEQLVKSWLGRLRTVPKHDKVIVTAGPGRQDAVSYVSRTEPESGGGTRNVITLDFYSALRNGFGELRKDEVENLLKII